MKGLDVPIKSDVPITNSMVLRFRRSFRKRFLAIFALFATSRALLICLIPRSRQQYRPLLWQTRIPTQHPSFPQEFDACTVCCITFR